MTKFLWIVIFTLLSGCAVQGKVATFTAGDASDAVSLATAVGDTSVIPCYQHIGAIGTAVANVSPTNSSVSMSLGSIKLGAFAGANTPGLLTEYEINRAVKGIEQDPACAQVLLDLVATALKLGVPGAAALIP